MLLFGSLFTLVLSTSNIASAAMSSSTASSSSSSTPPSSNTVEMAHIQNNPPIPSTASPPATLFLHGLDSSSHTWMGVLKDLEETSSQGVAIDFRGCGVSPNANIEDFSSDALVEDIKQFVDTHSYLHGSSSSSGNEGKQQERKRPFVLVGHSLGGRMAILYAAKYPEDVAALVIEDMDIKKRSVSPIALDMEKVYAFHRDGVGKGGGKEKATREDIINSLVAVGYTTERVKKWSKEGRIHFLQNGENNIDGKWWSDVNPQFRVLCYKHIFDNDSGEEAWTNIAASSSAYSFPCHLMVADKDLTVCDEKSVNDMIETMKDNASSRFNVHRYPGATHSIHNSARDEFMKDLRDIIQKAEKGKLEQE